ncbi:hypothetical protein, partial [Klebsiella pneumoniae]|uniref:hypothetical protein n=1 Tax=Klebsiella pneumoniae TaxID=573 RepID=UPI0023608F63
RVGGRLTLHKNPPPYPALASAAGGAIALLPRLRIDGSLKEKNACAEIRAGVKTGLFDNKLGASLNVMSMVFDEA